MDIGEQWTAYFARLVTAEPEIALEGFEVGDLEVLGHEVADVRFECFRGCPMFGGEDRAVGGEGGGVPLCG